MQDRAKLSPELSPDALQALLALEGVYSPENPIFTEAGFCRRTNLEVDTPIFEELARAGYIARADAFVWKRVFK